MSLITQRKQTSQAVAELWHNTFFNRHWRAIGKFLGRGNDVPVGVSAAVVMGLNFIVGTSVAFLLRENRFTSAQVVLADLLWVTYTYSQILVAIGSHAKMLDFVSRDFVNSMNRENDIRDLQAWAAQWLGRDLRQVLFSLLFASIVAPGASYALYHIVPISIGVTLIYFINFFYLAVSLYGLLALIAFLLRLKGWQLMLYPDDPGSTPILLQFSAQLRDYLLVYSFSVAIFMLFVQLVSGLNILIVIQFLIFSWLPILALFFLMHIAISAMITRVKHERMGEIQAQIMKLARQGKADTNVTAQILSLMTYHDRVKGARNSLINSQSIANLLGSLALPAIATLVQAYVKGLLG